MPEHAQSSSKRLSDLRAEIAQLDRLIEECDSGDAERLRTIAPKLQRQLESVAELATEFGRALDLWADPETQANLRAHAEQIASGKSLASVPIDQVVAEIERRLRDLDA